ncbi:unnamed protein product, partial [Mesorhabditis spiculigera]
MQKWFRWPVSMFIFVIVGLFIVPNVSPVTHLAFTSASDNVEHPANARPHLPSSAQRSGPYATFFDKNDNLLIGAIQPNDAHPPIPNERICTNRHGTASTPLTLIHGMLNDTSSSDGPFSSWAAIGTAAFLLLGVLGVVLLVRLLTRNSDLEGIIADSGSTIFLVVLHNCTGVVHGNHVTGPGFKRIDQRRQGLLASSLHRHSNYCKGHITVWYFKRIDQRRQCLLASSLHRHSNYCKGHITVWYFKRIDQRRQCLLASSLHRHSNYCKGHITVWYFKRIDQRRQCLLASSLHRHSNYCKGHITVWYFKRVGTKIKGHEDAQGAQCYFCYEPKKDTKGGMALCGACSTRVSAWVRCPDAICVDQSGCFLLPRLRSDEVFAESPNFHRTLVIIASRCQMCWISLASPAQMKKLMEYKAEYELRKAQKEAKKVPGNVEDKKKKRR